MKKIILSIIVFAFFANASAQFKVNSSGNVGIGKNPLYKLDVAGDIYIGSASNIFGTTNNNPITFKVNNVLAGFTGSSANSNVSFGYGALPNSSAGTNNIIYGYNALKSNTTGSYNTVIGNSALLKNTTGEINTAIGNCALAENTTGSGNTANGNLALLKNTTGGSNTANGNCTLTENTTGSGNTANGNLTLQFNTTGNNNTASGYQALYSNTTGSNNTAIGYYAGALSPNNLTNSTAIGYQAMTTSSYQIRIGNNTVGSIGGYVNWSNISDMRTKKNIKADVPGLDFINLLQPVTYNLDLDAIDNLSGIDRAKKEELEKTMPQDLKDKNEKAKKAKENQVQTGFVAQDVEKIAKSVGYDFSGVNVDEMGIYSLSYAEFVVPLVKAVQELSEQNAQLQEQINELKGNASLRSAANETGTTGITDVVINQCILYQNAPNPFNRDTQIKFYIPESVKVAQLCINNLQGTQIKQILIAQRSEGSQWISGSELTAGIYLYTLIVDGKVVDTKQMILTK
ncbi:MAG: tail fiber domain-containing protein [Candidatus Azobacteroides sp.]|nr:tail fiber domain-containing protein [Candidatus Azobacteroides sp.]